MPEVFANNPHPAQHIPLEIIQEIREKCDNKEEEISFNSIYKTYYKDIMSWSSFHDIYSRKRYPEDKK